MSHFTIEGFKENFTEGARGYLFYVLPAFPTTQQASTVDIGTAKARYMVRSSTLPTRTIEAIETPYQGYVYKYGGKSTFEEWTITFVVDGEAKIYDKYLKWMDDIHNAKTNEHGDPRNTAQGGYKVDQDVQLIDGKGKPIKSISLKDCWPTSVAALELAYDSADALTFDVTFSYLYHTDGADT